MQKISLHVSRVILLTILLVNSMLASAAMSCDMDIQNSDTVLVLDAHDQMEHNQHNMGAMDMTAMLTSESDCCDSDCLCEMGCSTHVVLLDSEPNQEKMYSFHGVIFYIDSIPNARQGKIFHPPILA